MRSLAGCRFVANPAQQADPLPDLGEARARRAPDLHEKAREPAVPTGSHQVMEACRLLRAFAREQLQRSVLVLEQPHAKLRVAQRIAAAVAQQPVILDQPMIGILRERDRRKLERVDRRQAGKNRVPEVPVQDRQVVLDDVVAEHERGAGRESFERSAQVRGAERSAEDYMFVGVGTPRGELVDDARLVARGLEIEAQAPWPQAGARRPDFAVSALNRDIRPVSSRMIRPDAGARSSLCTCGPSAAAAPTGRGRARHGGRRGGRRGGPRAAARLIFRRPRVIARRRHLLGGGRPAAGPALRRRGRRRCRPPSGRRRRRFGRPRTPQDQQLPEMLHRGAAEGGADAKRERFALIPVVLRRADLDQLMGPEGHVDLMQHGFGQTLSSDGDHRTKIMGPRPKRAALRRGERWHRESVP
jgi:hypothetical protein